MPIAPARAADEISTNIKSLVDKVLEADVTDRIAETSREVAGVVADATSTAAERATEAWRDTADTRRDAAKAVRGASRDAARWSDKLWRKRLRPTLKEIWGRRAVALGAAGAAVPASRELVDTAAVRLGLKKREERHWGSFFLGIVVGMVAGAAIAILTAPKPGRQVRENLAAKAREAGDWVPVFQRPEEGDGSGHTAAYGGAAGVAAGAAGFAGEGVAPSAGEQLPDEPIGSLSEPLADEPPMASLSESLADEPMASTAGGMSGFPTDEMDTGSGGLVGEEGLPAVGGTLDDESSGEEPPR